MAKSKNNLPGSTKPRPPNTLLMPVSGVTETTPQAGRSSDARTLSVAETIKSASINFGTPSSTRTTASQSGSEWTNLLKQTASGGIASALSGGLGSIGGLGSLISGIVSLFGGGKKTAAPLVEFQLPASVDQTVYLNSGGKTVYPGNSVEPSTAPNAGGGTYTTGEQGSESRGQALQYQSTQIAAAVKNALLNSSSLNDVIAEI